MSSPRRLDRPTGTLLHLLVCIVVGIAISGVLQLVTGVIPTTVASTTPPWFDDFYTWLQLAAAVVLLISYCPRVADAPAFMIEQTGSLFMAGALGSYFVATFDAVTYPKSSGVWVVGMLAIWWAVRGGSLTVDLWRARRGLKEG